jgi:hypothetical protein
VYVRNDRALIALASWAEYLVDVELEIDWDALGLDPRSVRIVAPEIRDFQIERAFEPGQRIPVAPGRGWLLVIQ